MNEMADVLPALLRERPIGDHSQGFARQTQALAIREQGINHFRARPSIPMSFLDDITRELDQLRAEGLYKHEAPLTTPQAAHVGTPDGTVINLCANNYLGLADSPVLINAAKAALDRWGFGMASVRFICGTQTQHQDLEARLTQFLRPGPGFDTILYSSCFDANGGLFETLFGAEDAIISDELNHASIIDGVRLSKAARYRYRNRDLDDLRAQLKAAKGSRHRVIATDGVFSMDGYIAPLDEICALADEYGALVMVDDSHAVGFVGETGAGTPELFGVADRVDIQPGARHCRHCWSRLCSR